MHVKLGEPAPEMYTSYSAPGITIIASVAPLIYLLRKTTIVTLISKNTNIVTKQLGLDTVRVV